MLQPQQPSPHGLPASPTQTGPLAFPSPEIRYGAIDLSDITDRVKAHNDGTGLGATLGRLIVGMINNLGELPLNTQVAPRKLMAHAINEESSQRESSRERFEADLAPTLAAIGLKVGPIKGGWEFVGVGQDFDSTKLSLHVEDGERFATYLAALAPGTITPSQKRGLNALYLTLCQQITTDYDLSSSDDRLLGLVGAAASIVEHFQRLDLPKKQLQTYLEAIRGRYLKSYVEVEKLQLDKPLENGDGYRLLWHRDTIPERLQSEWNKVLDLLVTLGGNENARHVYDTACKTARQAIEKSIAEVSRWNASPDSTHMAFKQPFLSILNAVKVRMSEF